jgi:hypothetical protein
MFADIFTPRFPLLPALSSPALCHAVVVPPAMEGGKNAPDEGVRESGRDEMAENEGTDGPFPRGRGLPTARFVRPVVCSASKSRSYGGCVQIYFRTNVLNVKRIYRGE